VRGDVRTYLCFEVRFKYRFQLHGHITTATTTIDIRRAAFPPIDCLAPPSIATAALAMCGSRGSGVYVKRNKVKPLERYRIRFFALKTNFRSVL
jgi:hypothetical protein